MMHIRHAKEVAEIAAELASLTSVCKDITGAEALTMKVLPQYPREWSGVGPGTGVHEKDSGVREQIFAASLRAAALKYYNSRIDEIRSKLAALGVDVD